MHRMGIDHTSNYTGAGQIDEMPSAGTSNRLPITMERRQSVVPHAIRLGVGLNHIGANRALPPQLPPVYHASTPMADAIWQCVDLQRAQRRRMQEPVVNPIIQRFAELIEQMRSEVRAAANDTPGTSIGGFKEVRRNLRFSKDKSLPKELGEKIRIGIVRACRNDDRPEKLTLNQFKIYINAISGLPTHEYATQDKQFLGIEMGRHVTMAFTKPKHLISVARSIARLIVDPRLGSVPHKLDAKKELSRSVYAYQYACATTDASVRSVVYAGVGSVTALPAIAIANLAHGARKEDKTVNKAIAWLDDVLTRIGKLGEQPDFELLVRCAFVLESVADGRKLSKLETTIVDLLEGDNLRQWQPLRDSIKAILTAATVGSVGNAHA